MKINTDMHDRLNRAIEKYQQGNYNEFDFHSTLASIIQSITEVELNDVRTFLLDNEADLELIDFTVNKDERRNRYLNIIENIKSFLIKFGEK